MSASGWATAPRGRYDISEPRAVRVFLLVSVLVYVPLLALGVALILLLLSRIPLERWREWPPEAQFAVPWLVLWLVLLPLAWWRFFPRTATAVEWDEDALVVRTIVGRAAVIPWEAVKELRVPFTSARMREAAGEAAGKARQRARLFVVGQRRPYQVPLLGDAGCTRFVGALKARGRVVEV